MSLTALAVALFSTACSSQGGVSPTSATPVAAPPPPRVVVVSIDGLRPDALSLERAPNIARLANQGAKTSGAKTILPSITLPAHASMLSGYEPKAHGLTWADYKPAGGYIKVATVFAAAKVRGYRTVMVVGKEKFKHIASPGTIDSFVWETRGDAAVANAAVVEVAKGFDLMFVHFPDVDLTGHSKGWLSSAYLNALTATDQAVGRLLAALPEGVTVIVTADHGGRSFNHGTDHRDEVTIPWIANGPNVVRGVTLSTAVKTVDTAATAAFVLGFSLPPDAVGRPVVEAFGANAATAAAAR